MPSWKLHSEINLFAALVVALGILLFSVCLGCSPQSHYQLLNPEPELHFVYSGLCITGLGDFEKIEKVLLAVGEKWLEKEFKPFGASVHIIHRWTPGRTHRIEIIGKIGGSIRSIIITGDAPQQPGLAIINIIDLQQHLGSGASLSAASTPTSCALSPDGKWCALGMDQGKLLLFSLPDGKLRASRFGGGSYIRFLEFAESNQHLLLFVGEQSSQGTVSAYVLDENGNINRLWSYETARDIGTSPRDPNDPYSWAHMPGVYRMMPSDSEDILVLATHSAGDAGGVEFSRLYRFNMRSGSLKWKWPASTNLAAVATWFDADAESGRIAVCAYETVGGTGSIYMIDGETGRLPAKQEIYPVRPYLEQVNFWRSVALAPGGSNLAAISNDGRAWLCNFLDESVLRELTLGAPLDIGGFPLMISGGAVGADVFGAVFITGTSFIPWRLSEGSAPPDRHPDSLKALGYSWDGELHWAAPLPNLVQGFALEPNQRWIAVSYASDPVYSPGGGSGLVIIEPKSADNSILAAYPVGGAVMHGSPLSAKNGRILLLAELAQRDRSGDRLLGSNALHVLC